MIFSLKSRLGLASISRFILVVTKKVSNKNFKGENYLPADGRIQYRYMQSNLMDPLKF